MKYLCLAFVIGWSGADYAGTGTSTPVTVPITIPSSGLTPPAEAAAAGFTTLAANYDFSQPLYATQSNWLDCVGNNTSLPWHVGTPGGISATNQICNIHQVTDPANSSLTVLDIKYLGSYPSYAAGGNGSSTAMQTVTAGGTGQGGITTFAAPNGYIEATYRIGAITPANSATQDGVWTWIADNLSPGFGALEFDIAELWSSGAADANAYLAPNTGGWNYALWATWDFNCANNAGCTGRLPSGYNSTVYHRYGALFTSNGTASSFLCGFIDGVYQSCQYVNAPYLSRSWLIAWIGASNDGVSSDLYIQNIRVWSCAGWATGNCYGSTLAGPDGPNGSVSGLTYWH
jgi:hypothetical protein